MKYDTRYMLVDFETRSRADLRKIGGWDYSCDPTTQILCTGYKIGTRADILNQDTIVSTATDWEFMDALLDPEIELVAHNVFFELSIITNVLSREYPEVRDIPLSRWHCTAAMSRRMGLPGKLEKVAEALDLEVLKDMEGHEIMLKLAAYGEAEGDDMDRLLSYCGDDIDVEALVFTRLPMLDRYERDVWENDIRMNLRGFLIDRTLVHNALEGIQRVKTWADSEVLKLTKGAVKSARQREKFLAYLNNTGFDLPDCRRNTVQTAITDTATPPKAKRLLQLRLISSKSSTAKYTKLEHGSRIDGRARDTMIYYGAHTGRQSAVRIQPHNLPKQLESVTDDQLEIGLGLLGAGRYEDLEAMFPNPNDFYSSAVKPMIIAEPGKVLHVADFSTVEVRVLFWIAGNQSGLDAIRAGRDLYIEMASRIFSIPVDVLTREYKAKVPAAIMKRQLGKQTVLGAGFGIGVGGQKFQMTCRTYGLEIPLALASKSIVTYRKVNPDVPKFWHKIEAAAIKAVISWGEKIRCGRLTFVGVQDRAGNRWLRCVLPSGRSIFYFTPEVKYQRHGNVTSPILVFATYDPKKRKMVRESTWGGKLTENVVQGMARDITMEAISRCDAEGFDPLLAVHDAIITETDSGRDETPFDLIRQIPVWCPDLPIGIEHWTMERYG